MRRAIFFVGVLILITRVFGQNGFETIELGFNPIAYAVDQNGTFWFTDSEKIYEYNSEIVNTFDASNTDLTFDIIKNIWLDQDFLIVATGDNVFRFDPDNPYNSVDLELNKTLINSFFDGENFVAISVIDVGILGIDIYDGETWYASDTLPQFASIEGMSFFQDALYISFRNLGLYKYQNDQFELILDGTYYDLIKWNNNLWLTDGNTFGVLVNGNYLQWIMQAGLDGGRHFQICNNELWSGGFNKLFHIKYDHINSYETNDDVHAFPNYGANSNQIHYVYSNKLITFNSEEYLSDQSFISLENTAFTSINNVEAMLSVFGTLFWDLQSDGHYYVPKTGNVSSMFAASLWLAGKDGDNVVHAAYEKYIENGTRFTPGPLDANASISEEVRDKYNRIWHLDRATIENFIYRYEIGDITNGSWPVDYFIETWPGNVDPGYTSRAPFVDANSDGFYDPMDGDYPDILGDEMLYWVVNDNNHQVTGFDTTKNLGVEIQYKVWSNRYENPTTGDLTYFNDTSELVNNTIFMDVDIINRSENLYHDFYVGLWADGDLGNPFDDYVGVDVMNHSVYFYNGDAYDDVQGTPPGYGYEPPAQAVTFLDAPIMNSLPLVDTGCFISKFVSYDRSEDINGIPEEFDDFYNYLRGKWQDGSDVTFGGFGFDSSEVVADYMYPGNSDIYNIGTSGIDMGEWSEVTALHTPSDKSGVASTGPLVFFPGDTLSFRFAFPFVRDESSSFPYSIDKLQDVIPLLHNWQRTGEFPSNYNIELVSAGINLRNNPDWIVEIYPNPAQDFIFVKSQLPNCTYKIYDLGGRELLYGKVENGLSRINTGFLSNGLYIISMTDGLQVVSKKIVIK
jgi:hypothetical protein